MNNSTLNAQPSKEELLTVALGYATELGWYIVPLWPLVNLDGRWVCTCPYKVCEKKKSSGKHPCIGWKWPEESSNNPDVIRQWWEKWPQAGIGLHCGKSGILALDFDCYKADYQGDALLSELDERTPTVISGRGGRHLLYCMPEGVMFGNKSAGLPKGIDVRGENGILCLPPTLHFCGRQYAWA